MSLSITKPLWALGLMSGTSADGIDAALIQTDGLAITNFGPTHYISYPKNLKSQILNTYGCPPGSEKDSLEQSITEYHIEAVFSLLEKANLEPSNIDAIGFHGQTLFHKPPARVGEKGETYIIGNGPLLASRTGITVVDQLRLNDIVNGGQGAPLVPVFHQALAKDLPKPIAILNIGGVANVTWIGDSQEKLLAFDTGPGNGLMDDLVREHSNLLWDEEGKIAASGCVHEGLIKKWLSHPYFTRKSPKALDRQTFKSFLDEARTLSFENGVATLTAFTARTLEKALAFFPEKPSQWLVAGGGAHNLTLLNMMQECLEMEVQKASDKGWDGDALEAQAFGFLAVRSLRGLPLTFPGTTGVAYPLTGGRVCKPVSM
ncbi:MAG: anhydro-N-acetylmuramic acid kinase [Proteobacteria bacterium]|nr:anhydro-N-acetylmuramic acid kinase [Pseudomonadota bacterium]